MDLDICPKCGVSWRRWDRCPACGFVPIGVGLDKLPKKKRKRVRRYVEPGSSRGFLVTMLVMSLGAYGFMYKPWQDDWEFFRALVGQGRFHSLVGSWQIAKSVSLGGKSQPLFSRPNIDRGVIQFSKSGVIKLHLGKGDQESQASGHYDQKGLTLKVETLAGDSPTPLPNTLSADLSWVGEDLCIARIEGHETVYLRRRKNSIANNALAQKFSNLDVPQSAAEQSSTGVRGWIGTYGAAGN